MDTHHYFDKNALSSFFVISILYVPIFATNKMSQIDSKNMRFWRNNATYLYRKASNLPLPIIHNSLFFILEKISAS
jgi:hypothetical protein